MLFRSVTNMSTMFSRATSFNQPLTNFDTKNVTNMSGMFYGATSFNQPLGSFKIDNVTYMSNMLSGCGMSCQNLSTTLDGWKTQAATLNKNNIYLGDITTVHNAYNQTGQAAINTLRNNHNWIITGGQFAPGCILPTYYISEWDLSKPVWPTRPDAATTLVTNLVGGEFTLMWENLNDPTDNGSINIASGTPTNPCKIPGLTAGAKYRIIARSEEHTSELQSR